MANNEYSLTPELAFSNPSQFFDKVSFSGLWDDGKDYPQQPSFGWQDLGQNSFNLTKEGVLAGFYKKDDPKLFGNVNFSNNELQQTNLNAGIEFSKNPNPYIQSQGRQLISRSVTSPKNFSRKLQNIVGETIVQETDIPDRPDYKKLGSIGLDFIGNLSETFGGGSGTQNSALTSGINSFSSTLEKAPVIGNYVKIANTAGKFANATYNKIDEYEGQSAGTKIFGSNLLGWTGVNKIGSKKLERFNLDSSIKAASGNSYGGALSAISKAEDLGGKRIGTFDVGSKSNIYQKGKDNAVRLSGIINDAQDMFGRREGSYNTYLRRLYNMYNTLNNNIKIRKNGGTLVEKPAEIPKSYVLNEVSFDSIPVEYLEDGGVLKEKTRTLEELIEYAKQKNPRFIQRMSEPVRSIDLGDGRTGTHRLTWGTTDKPNEAVVYPEIFENDKGELVYDPEHAIDNAKKGDALLMTPEEAVLFTEQYKKGWPQFFNKFKEGGKVNVIPEGALHARLHHMEDADNLTKKGIPVVTEKEGGELEQQAEIEREEIIFRLEVTKKLEELLKKYSDEETSQKDKDEIAIEAGKLLVEEILNNTVDNTNTLL